MRIFHSFLGTLAGVLVLALPAQAGMPAVEPGAALQLSPELSRLQPAPQPTMISAAIPPAPPILPVLPAPGASVEIRDDLPPLPTIDLTTPPDDLWQHVRNGFGMADLNSPLVARQQAWYLNRPDALKRIFERSRRYLYHIVTELEKRGMPTELALLPMVESSYNPLAYSSARALGMWQFIPSTGKSYKLDQNAWLDERRDIIASTSAALDYLQNIYEMHGDWQLALASYNWGEHAVARAIAKNQAKKLPTDYASLTMPDETRTYVPKLQAFKNILAQPELFGIRLDPIPNRPYFDTVNMPSDVDITLAARLAEVPLEEFIALNPAWHRPVILGANSSPLVLPAGKVQTFLDNLERHEAADKPLTSWTTYRLKNGEKLASVAGRFHITEGKLKQLNGITRRTKVGPGFALLVPGPGASPDLLAAYLPRAPSDPPKVVKSKGRQKAKGKAIRNVSTPMKTEQSGVSEKANAGVSRRYAGTKKKPVSVRKRM